MHRMYRVCMHTMKTSQQIKQLMNDYPSKNANYLTIHHLPTFPRDAYMISFNRHTLPSTHTLTSDQSVHDLPLWILTGRPTDPLFGDREYRVPRPYSPPHPTSPPTGQSANDLHPVTLREGSWLGANQRGSWDHFADSQWGWWSGDTPLLTRLWSINTEYMQLTMFNLLTYYLNHRMHQFQLFNRNLRFRLKLEHLPRFIILVKRAVIAR